MKNEEWGKGAGDCPIICRSSQIRHPSTNWPRDFEALRPRMIKPPSRAPFAQQPSAFAALDPRLTAPAASGLCRPSGAAFGSLPRHLQVTWLSPLVSRPSSLDSSFARAREEAFPIRTGSSHRRPREGGPQKRIFVGGDEASGEWGGMWFF